MSRAFGFQVVGRFDEHFDSRDESVLVQLHVGHVTTNHFPKLLS